MTEAELLEITATPVPLAILMTHLINRYTVPELATQ